MDDVLRLELLILLDTLGVNAGQLASEMHADPAYLRKLLSGRRPLTDAYLTRIYAALTGIQGRRETAWQAARTAGNSLFLG